MHCTSDGHADPVYYKAEAAETKMSLFLFLHEDASVIVASAASMQLHPLSATTPVLATGVPSSIPSVKHHTHRKLKAVNVAVSIAVP